MDENRNGFKPENGNGYKTEETNEKKDKLKTPIRIYILVLVAVTVAASIIGTSVYVAPVVKRIGSIFSVDLEDVAKIHEKIDIPEIAGDGDIEEKLDELIEKGAENLKENLSSGRIAVDSGEMETGSWTGEKSSGISRIDADVSMINLEIRTGDELSADWESSGVRVPDIYMEGSTLKIRQEDDPGAVISFSFGKRFDVDGIGANLTLTVPDDVCLDELNIDADAGNIVITGVKSRKSEIEADLGNIVLTECDLGKLSVGADCGNVEMIKDAAEDAEIKADLGKVYVKEGSFGTLCVQADCGAIECEAITADRVDLHDDAGSISVSGEYNALKADCSLGSIEVETAKPENEVRLDLHTDLGSVTVNGRER